MTQTVQGKCKFCERPLSIEVDSEYAGLGDPYKLLELLSCQRCSALRVRQRNIVNGLKIVSAPDFERDRKEPGERLLRAYCTLISEWLGIEPALEWQPELLAEYLRCPGEPGPILGKIWKTAKWAKANQRELI